MENLNKIHQKLFKLETGNKALVNRQADGHTLEQVNTRPHNYHMAGYKNAENVIFADVSQNKISFLAQKGANQKKRVPKT